jgi:hypothetical protein
LSTIIRATASIVQVRIQFGAEGHFRITNVLVNIKSTDPPLFNSEQYVVTLDAYYSTLVVLLE